MAFRKYKDLAVKVSEYTTSSGEKKGRWQNVGSIMQDETGAQFLMISKWFNFAGVPDLSGKGGDSVLVSMFDPNPHDNAAPAPAAAPAPSQPHDDDIPF